MPLQNVFRKRHLLKLELHILCFCCRQRFPQVESSRVTRLFHINSIVAAIIWENGARIIDLMLIYVVQIVKFDYYNTIYSNS